MLTRLAFLFQIKPHDLGTPAYALAERIPPSPLYQREKLAAVEDLYQQIMWTNFAWSDQII